MITYRLATTSDAAQVVSLLQEIMQLHGVTPPDPARLHATLAAILDSPHHLLLVAQAEDPLEEDRLEEDRLGEDRLAEGRLVGMCALVFSQSTWSASPVCELQDVVVTRTARRTDVGQGLVRAAEEIARDRGCSRLFLLAEYWNLDAHAFYRSLGLTEKTCLYFERDLRGAPPT